MPLAAFKTYRSSGLAPASVAHGGCLSHLAIRALRGAVMLALCLAALTPRPALAGGGPENVLLVVNQNSWASQTIANHWRHWRSIPERNIVSLNWTGDPWSTEIGTFRDEILLPIERAINERGLADQIDYIIYAADFPYVVDFRSESANPQDDKAGGSLTGLTYLASSVLSHNNDYTNLNANAYYRRSLAPDGAAATHGFRHTYGWAPTGELLPAAGGQHYYLSTCLAYTSGRGNSVAEALRSLERSVYVDGLQPEGTFYFLANDNVRSTTRQNQFAPAIAELQRMGHRAEIAEGIMPLEKADVMGAMLGHFNFKWTASSSEIMPGAICENLTSYGGIMRYNQHQPPLTDLLTAGAAGSSGTVIEPFATPAKFPNAGIHVHYARGSSLAEAFYQSVHGPYQLLVVGDPLCRPWANIPYVELPEFEAGQTISGVVQFAPQAECGETGIAEMRLFIDGRLHSTAAPGETIALDTTELLDGYHELRFVAIEDSPLESQGRLLLPVTVDNEGEAIEWSLSPAGQISWDQRIVVSARAPGAGSIQIIHQGRLVGEINSVAGETVINSRDLGLGPASLQAIALGRGSGGPMAYSQPLEIEIVEPSLLPAQPGIRQAALTPGVRVTPQGGEPRVAATTEDKNWLTDAGVRPGQPFVLNGYFEVAESGMAQFQARFTGQLALSVDGVSILDANSPEQTFAYAPVGLAAGWHEFTASATLNELRELRFDFGEQGAAPLSVSGFHCQP